MIGPRQAAALCGLAAATAYATAVPSALLWDDVLLVERNLFLRSVRHLPDLLFADLFRGAGLAAASYRPLQGLSYFVEYQLFGLVPSAYHLTNVLLHAAAAAMLCLLLSRLVPLVAAGAAAALWAVHPVHTEAIAYVSGRADPLAMLWMLAALVLDLRRGPTPWARPELLRRDLPAVGCFVLALGSRESATILPLLVFLARAFSAEPSVPRERSRAAFLSTLPYVAILLAYAAARSFLLDLGTTRTTLVLALGDRVLCAAAALGRYAGLLLWPMGLHMERSFRVPDGLDRLDVQAGIVLAAALVWGILRLRTRLPAAALGLSWFLATWLPISGLFPLNALLAEHWMYAPSAGLALAGAAALSRFPLPRGGTVWVYGAAFLSCFALTSARCLDWKTAESLYPKTAARAPWSARVRANLGQYYADRGRTDEAFREYQAALAAAQLGKDYPGEFASGVVVGQVYANLCNLYRDRGDLPSAIEAGRRAAAMAPQIAESHTNLGVALLNSGRVDDARAAFRDGLRANPRSAAAHSNMGNTYFHEGKLAEALSHYESSLAVDPRLGDAWNNRGSVLFRLGRTAEALDSFRRAQALKPESPEIAKNLTVAEAALRGGAAAKSGPVESLVNEGTALANAGRLAEAEERYVLALRREPSNVAAHFNLGLIAETRGDRAAARRRFERASRLDPSFAPARDALARLR